MVKPAAKYGCGVILRTLFLGVCLGGIPLAGLGAWGTWRNPPNPATPSKDDSDEQTVLGNACTGFGFGAVLGGFAGLIGGVILDAYRRLREEFSGSES